jgi:hypothetical protein
MHYCVRLKISSMDTIVWSMAVLKFSWAHVAWSLIRTQSCSVGKSYSWLLTALSESSLLFHEKSPCLM